MRRPARCAVLVLAGVLGGSVSRAAPPDPWVRLEEARFATVRTLVADPIAPTEDPAARAMLWAEAEAMVRLEARDRVPSLPEGTPPPDAAPDAAPVEEVRRRFEELRAARAGPPEPREVERDVLLLRFAGTLPPGTSVEVRALAPDGGAPSLGPIPASWPAEGPLEIRMEGGAAWAGPLRIELVALGDGGVCVWADLIDPGAMGTGAVGTSAGVSPAAAYRDLFDAHGRLAAALRIVQRMHESDGAPDPAEARAALADLLAAPLPVPDTRWGGAVQHLLDARWAIEAAWTARVPSLPIGESAGDPAAGGTPVPSWNRMEEATRALESLAGEWLLDEPPGRDDLGEWVASLEACGAALDRLERGEGAPRTAYEWRVQHRRWILQACDLERRLPAVAFAADREGLAGLPSAGEGALRALLRRATFLSLRHEAARPLLDLDEAIDRSRAIWESHLAEARAHLAG